MAKELKPFPICCLSTTTLITLGISVTIKSFSKRHNSMQIKKRIPTSLHPSKKIKNIQLKWHLSKKILLSPQFLNPLSSKFLILGALHPFNMRKFPQILASSLDYPQLSCLLSFFPTFRYIHKIKQALYLLQKTSKDKPCCGPSSFVHSLYSGLPKQNNDKTQKTDKLFGKIKLS